MNAVDEHAPRWFAWREVQEALAYARAGAVALHHFHWDLRRFGLGRDAPACHVLAANREELLVFGAQFGLPAWALQPPRRHRPGIWHFDAFGRVLERLLETYPLPWGIDEDRASAS